MPRPSRKQHLLEAAARLFAERGFEAVGVRDIAEAAGLRSASVYRHFPGKQELFDAVLHLVSHKAGRPRHAYLSSDQLTNEEKLKGFVCFTLMQHEADDLHRLITQRALVDNRRDILETLVHHVYADQHYVIMDIIRQIEPEKDPSFSLYTILSLALGYIHLRPLQDILRRLTTQERDPVFLTHSVLEMVIPKVDWRSVRLVTDLEQHGQAST